MWGDLKLKLLCSCWGLLLSWWVSRGCSVQCSQSWRRTWGWKKCVWTPFNTNHSPLFVADEVKKVVCNTSWYHSDSRRNCRVGILKSVKYSTSVVVYILPSPLHTHSYTHSHSSTCPTSSSSNCETQKLSRRRKRRRVWSSFDHRLPLLDQLPSGTVATTITPHPSLTLSLCVPHCKFVLSIYASHIHIPGAYEPPWQEAPSYIVTSLSNSMQFYCCYFHVACFTSYLLYSYVCVSDQKWLTHLISRDAWRDGWMRVLLWK